MMFSETFHTSIRFIPTGNKDPHFPSITSSSEKVISYFKKTAHLGKNATLKNDADVDLTVV